MKVKSKRKREESVLQKAAMQWMTLHKVEFWRMPLGAVLHSRGGEVHFGRNPLKGFPDLAGVFKGRQRGRFFAIELKSRTGRPAPEQLAWRNRLLAAGAAHKIIKNINELICFFVEHGEVDGARFGFPSS